MNQTRGATPHLGAKLLDSRGPRLAVLNVKEKGVGGMPDPGGGIRQAETNPLASRALPLLFASAIERTTLNGSI